MRSLEQINRDIDRWNKVGFMLAVIGMAIGILIVIYSAAGLYYIQKNSPSVETRADAQITNA